MCHSCWVWTGASVCLCYTFCLYPMYLSEHYCVFMPTSNNYKKLINCRLMLHLFQQKYWISFVNVICIYWCTSWIRIIRCGRNTKATGKTSINIPNFWSSPQCRALLNSATEFLLQNQCFCLLFTVQISFRCFSLW